MPVTRKANSDHVVIGSGGRFQCNHCGATHNPFEGGKAVELWAVTAGHEPAEPDDFGRCFRLLNAPWASTWKARIGEMSRYGDQWARLAARWPDLEALFLTENPSGQAPRLYALMKELIGR